MFEQMSEAPIAMRDRGGGSAPIHLVDEVQFGPSIFPCLYRAWTLIIGRRTDCTSTQSGTLFAPGGATSCMIHTWEYGGMQ